MGNAAKHLPETTLTLQTLIDTRHSILRQRTAGNIGKSNFPGQRTGPRRGEGLEFVDLRQYNSGDDMRHIDWNITARSTEPYTRLYQEERDHSATVVVDLRSVMFTGTNRLRAVSASLLAAGVLWQASHAGDRCAAIVIGANGIQTTRPAASHRGVLRALELIASEFNSASYGQSDRQPNRPLSAAFNQINQRNRQSGSYFFFSGFDLQANDHYGELLPASAMQGQLKSILLLDPSELTGIPVGRYRYKSPDNTSVKKTTITKTNRIELARALQNNIRQRERLFDNAGAPLLPISTETSVKELLALLQQHRWL